MHFIPTQQLCGAAPKWEINRAGGRNDNDRTAWLNESRLETAVKRE